MSRTKLTIVVTCTDRKATSPSPALMARGLPKGTVHERSQVWQKRLKQAVRTVPLLELYRGETWTQVKRLIATAKTVGFEPSVLVASAGLGLRSLDDTAPAYAATFSMGHEDSVAQSLLDARAWWCSLPRASLTLDGRPKLWVLSEAYARAMAPEVVADLADGDVVIGGSRDIPPASRVPADRSLRHALGGTATSLTVRMASRWLELSEGRGLNDSSVQQAWRDWSRAARCHERYDRAPQSDDTLLTFIASIRERQPDISRTRALRALRDSGWACEQGRFSALYAKVVGQ